VIERNRAATSRASSSPPYAHNRRRDIDRCWEARIVLHRKEELRESVIEASAEQKRSANYIENLTKSAARAETQRSLSTLDCSLKLAGKKP
jgi:hypothetical protein